MGLMARCYLHPKSDNTLHSVSVEDLERQIGERFLSSRAVQLNPHLYCKHGAYRGDHFAMHSCCFCDKSGVRCYESEVT